MIYDDAWCLVPRSSPGYESVFVQPSGGLCDLGGLVFPHDDSLCGRPLCRPPRHWNRRHGFKSVSVQLFHHISDDLFSWNVPSAWSNDLTCHNVTHPGSCHSWQEGRCRPGAGSAAGHAHFVPSHWAWSWLMMMRMMASSWRWAAQGDTGDLVSCSWKLSRSLEFLLAWDSVLLQVTSGKPSCPYCLLVILKSKFCPCLTH